MQTKMIMWAIEMLLSRLDKEQIREWIGLGIKLGRDKVLSTETKIDDKLLLPLLDMMEDVCGLDD